MGQTTQIGKHMTRIIKFDGDRAVQYHDTVVVREKRLADDQFLVTLNSNGYRTPTTKTRMNQTSSEWNLGFHVWQKDFMWYVDILGRGSVQYFDGMQFAVRK